MANSFIYVGTFTKTGRDGGIGIFHYDRESGSASYVKTVFENVVAGQMFIDRRRGVLYAVDERREDKTTGELGGRVWAFAIDGESGDLTEINHKSSFGTMTAYLTPDATGDYLLACNHNGLEWTGKVSRDSEGRYHFDPVYTDSTLVLYPLAADGAIGDPCDIRVFPVDSYTACLHYVKLSPDGKWFGVCDRNQNRVYFLSLDYEQRRLVLRSTAQFPCGTTHKNGLAPRYGAFHPTQKIFYFNSEYSPRLVTMAYDDNGGLETRRIQLAEPDLPDIDKLKYSQSDLKVGPDGHFLYQLYRDVNVVCTFAIDPSSGLPDMVQTLPLEGEGPRGMEFSPDGRFLLVANLDSQEITTLAVQPDGLLKATGARAFGMGNPGNLVFYEG